MFLNFVRTQNLRQIILYAKIKIIKSNVEGEKEFIVTPDGNYKNSKKKKSIHYFNRSC